MLTQETIDIIREGLALKEASIKRAMTGAKPAFAALYEKDLATIAAARSELLTENSPSTKK